MESRYGIGINNRYALFLDSEDGEDLSILAKKKAMEQAAKAAPITPAPAAAETKPVKKADNLAADNKKIRNSTTKDSKPNNREGRFKDGDIYFFFRFCQVFLEENCLFMGNLWKFI